MLNDIIQFFGVPPANLLYAGKASDETNATVYNYSSGYNCGPDAADRDIFVFAMVDRNAATTGTLTIGGNAATKIGEAFDSFSQQLMQLWRLRVPTGATPAIQHTVSGAANRGGIVVWAATGLLNAGVADETYVGNGTNPQSFSSIDVQDGGFAIFASTLQFAGSSMTWTGATEQDEFTMGTGGTIMGTAKWDGPVTGGSGQVTYANSGRTTFLGASFR